MRDRHQAPAAPWAAFATEALTMVGAFAAGVVLIGIGAAVAKEGWGFELEAHPMVGLALSPIIIGIAGLVYRTVATSADPAEPRALSDKPASWGSSLGWVVGLGAVLIVGSTLLSMLFERVGWVVAEQDRVVELTSSVDGGINPAVWVLAPVAGLAAPLVEEWLFRGWFFRRLLQRSGRAIAYLASAVMFAAIHGNLYGTPVYLLQAVLFALAYERTGRLFAAIGVHFINNAITLAMLVAGGGTPPV